MQMKSHALTLGLLAGLLPVAGAAQDFRFEGELGLIARNFQNDGAYAGQIGSGTSVIGTARLSLSGDLSFGRFLAEVYATKDTKTEVSSFDISKAYVAGDIGNLRWLLGSDIVFWGVTESHNPVNIINQRGSFADVGGDQRLGQPMLKLSFDTDRLGTFSFLGLLDFREQTYATAPERFRLDTTPDKSRTIFESDNRIDLALRNTNTLSLANGSLDYAVSLFSGRDRTPVYLPGCSQRTDSVSEATCQAVNADVQAAYEGLSTGNGTSYIAQVFSASSPATQSFLLAGDSVGGVPYYQDLHQIGLELNYSTGDWQFKFEGAQRITERDSYFSGVAGVEYAFPSIGDLEGSLTGAVEYIYDNRSEFQPATFLNDDVFAALRYDFNNIADTQLTLGGLYDLESDGTIVNLSLSSRLSDNARIEVGATFIDADDPTDPLSALNDDDFLEVNLSYFF